MLEAMISSGVGRGQTFPDSGPGPKTLKNGTTELGYFGEISSAELFSLGDLRRQLNFWVGVDRDPNPTWVKLFSSGKVIYFPTQPLVGNVSWNTLYAAGLVYGTDDNGVVPDYPAVNQLTYLTKDKSSFKVRCFKSQESDPSNQAGVEAIGTSALLKASEWGRVINAIVSPRQSGYTGDNWALYPNNGYFLSGALVGISQNTRQADQKSYLGINNTQVSLVAKISSGNLWFPVLELVPPTDLLYLPIKDPIATPQGRLLPLVVNDPDYEDALIVYRVFSGGVQMGRAINVGSIGYVDPYYRINASEIKIATNPGLPLIVGPVIYE